MNPPPPPSFLEYQNADLLLTNEAIVLQLNFLRQELTTLRDAHTKLQDEHRELRANFDKWINRGLGVTIAVSVVATTTGYVASMLKSIGLIK